MRVLEAHQAYILGQQGWIKAFWRLIKTLDCGCVAWDWWEFSNARCVTGKATFAEASTRYCFNLESLSAIVSYAAVWPDLLAGKRCWRSVLSWTWVVISLNDLPWLVILLFAWLGAKRYLSVVKALFELEVCNIIVSRSDLDARIGNPLIFPNWFVFHITVY